MFIADDDMDLQALLKSVKEELTYCRKRIKYYETEHKKQAARLGDLTLIIEKLERTE